MRTEAMACLAPATSPATPSRSARPSSISTELWASDRRPRAPRGLSVEPKAMCVLNASSPSIWSTAAPTSSSSDSSSGLSVPLGWEEKWRSGATPAPTPAPPPGLTLLEEWLLNCDSVKEEPEEGEEPSLIPKLCLPMGYTGTSSGRAALSARYRAGFSLASAREGWRKQAGVNWSWGVGAPCLRAWATSLSSTSALSRERINAGALMTLSQWCQK
mmetsp:Transcript_24556/g.54571  ORF Transcript_24556/g.54571 Transcript_24556/m.54571 type:complete len:216 (-) Transcript_24556:1355-2002(-)